MKAWKLIPLCASLIFTAQSFADQGGYPASPGAQHCPITPDGNPKTTGMADFFFTADFIYWTAREEGLAYTIGGADFSIPPVSTPSGRIREPDWDFDPGFKVGVGVKMGHDGWDLYTEYTWLHASPSDSINAPGTFLPTLGNGFFILVNSFPNPPASADFQSANEKWSLRFNAIDLELGRDYFISKYLTLRPHFGLKGTWQDQDLRIKYTFVDTNQFTIRNKQDSWGIGIRTGLNACWHFIKCFGLYGDFSISGLWSGFNNHRKDNRILPDGTTQNIFDSRRVTHSVKPIFEFGLGLRYELLYNEDDFRFLIQAGWEEQVWIGQNNFIDIAEYGDRGNMTLQGFTLEVRFDF